MPDEQVVDPRCTRAIAGSRLDLISALRRLHTRQPSLAEALVHRDVCKLGYGEIADILEVPLSTVKSRIRDARLFIRPASSAARAVFAGRIVNATEHTSAGGVADVSQRRHPRMDGQLPIR